MIKQQHKGFSAGGSSSDNMWGIWGNQQGFSKGGGKADDRTSNDGFPWLCRIGNVFCGHNEQEVNKNHKQQRILVRGFEFPK